MFRTNVNEMNVQPIDLGDELRQGVQFRLALAPIVFCPPVARECLNRRELHALRRIRDCFPFRPLGCVDAPPQFGKLRFRKIRLKRANRILVCLFAGSLCSSAFGHGVPLSSRFGLLPTMELVIIVFTSLEGPAPSVSGKDAITKRTPGALSPGKSTVIESSVGLVATNVPASRNRLAALSS